MKTPLKVLSLVLTLAFAGLTSAKVWTQCYEFEAAVDEPNAPACHLKIKATSLLLQRISAIVYPQSAIQSTNLEPWISENSIAGPHGAIFFCPPSFAAEDGYCLENELYFSVLESETMGEQLTYLVVDHITGSTVEVKRPGRYCVLLHTIGPNDAVDFVQVTQKHIFGYGSLYSDYYRYRWSYFWFKVYLGLAVLVKLLPVNKPSDVLRCNNITTDLSLLLLTKAVLYYGLTAFLCNSELLAEVSVSPYIHLYFLIRQLYTIALAAQILKLSRCRIGYRSASDFASLFYLTHSLHGLIYLSVSVAIAYCPFFAGSCGPLQVSTAGVLLCATYEVIRDCSRNFTKYIDTSFEPMSLTVKFQYTARMASRIPIWTHIICVDWVDGD